MKTRTKSHTTRKAGSVKLQSKPIFTHGELMAALHYAKDTLNRCSMPFMLLDDLAYCAKNNSDIQAQEISIGVKRRHYTISGSRMLMSLWKDAMFNKVNISYKYKGVPIIIWVIDRELEFFKNPDIVFYCYETFNIPNPFPVYWHKRDLLQ